MDEGFRLTMISFLTPLRFDLMAKIIYGYYREMSIHSDFGINLYKEHLRSWNGFKEYDNPNKNSFIKYKENFDSILDSIKLNGFDSNFAVPTTADGHLLNGAHRVAASIIHGAKVESYVDTDPKAGQVNCGSEFFRQQGLDEKWLDAMALDYSKLKSGTKIITLYPARNSIYDPKAEELIYNTVPVVYQKTLKLNDQGLLNYISQLYFGEPWLSYAGLDKKTELCRGEAGVRVFLIESSDLERTQSLKKNLRDIYEIENHSLHINDTDAETRRIARVVFNDNSINFLNKGNYFYSSKLVELISLYKKILDVKFQDPDSFCITGSAIMTLFGLRECADLDYLHLDPRHILGGHDLINSHETELEKYPLHKHDILLNPFNHFFFNDIKFATLGVVKALKTNRGEEKDKVDVKLMEGIGG